MPIDEFADEMNFPIQDDDTDYETVAGFVIDEIKRLPPLGVNSPRRAGSSK
jgi:putative hemolysin